MNSSTAVSIAARACSTDNRGDYKSHPWKLIFTASSIGISSSSNVALNAQGQVKVLDFGLAKQLNHESVVDASPDARTIVARTRAKGRTGTPLYLSPEQATGGPVDARSDLFALGASL
ncbi:MAG: hypothetical protein WKF84_08340 [Pyrinomonadaceae bacterium]